MFKPRPKQAEVLAYRRGYMGVAAVPGSGKTATLSYLAAQLLAETELADGGEILIVTLVNSAATNFARVSTSTSKAMACCPAMAIACAPCTAWRTISSAASQPPRASTISSPSSMSARATRSWPRRLMPGPPLSGSARCLPGARVCGQGTLSYAEVGGDLDRDGAQFHQAGEGRSADADDVGKNARRLPGRTAAGGDLRRNLQRLRSRAGLSRGGRFSRSDPPGIEVLLQENPTIWLRCSASGSIILEDEAQDSSRLQEDILRALAGEGGNWVRVGDPNQAIFETFTTADPKYLREFIASDGVEGRELPNSGRSTRSIQKLANHLIAWSLEHPHQAIRERMPLSKPYIQPTPAGDPQPNPVDDPAAVVLFAEAYSATKEAHDGDRILQALAGGEPRGDGGDIGGAQHARLGDRQVPASRRAALCRESQQHLIDARGGRRLGARAWAIG